MRADLCEYSWPRLWSLTGAQARLRPAGMLLPLPLHRRRRLLQLLL